MRKLYIFGLIALAGIIIGFAWAEQITLTTYYPAPYGVYKEMKANLFHANPQTPATATGHLEVPAGEESAWEGKMYYNDGSGGAVSKGVYYYDGFNWSPLGAGAAPGKWNHLDVQVYAGTEAASWTDLDLSSHIGSNYALVLLKFTFGNISQELAVRRKGDSGEYWGRFASQGSGVHYACGGTAGSKIRCSTVLTATDVNGVVQWKGDPSIPGSVTITLLGYIK